MKLSPLDVVLVCAFLTAAIIGGNLKVLSPQLVAAIITGALAFLAMRVKVMGTKEKAEEKPKEREDGAPDKPLEKHHSHRILVDDDGSIKVEDVTPDPDADKPE